MYSEVPRTSSLANFKSIIEGEISDHSKKHPVILSGFNVGDCVHKWSSMDYLRSKMCMDVQSKRIVVHVSSSKSLSFIKKNFRRQEMSCETLLNKLSDEQNSTEKYYFRSFNVKDSNGKAANFHQDYPSLSKDVILPQLFDPELQIRGQKTCWLFDPDQIPFLHMNGDKSMIDDSEDADWDNVDVYKYQLFARSSGFRCVLNPGDILFFPALWLHNTRTDPTTWSISLNVFWYELDDRNLYDPADVYGNRDLLVAHDAITAIQRSMASIKHLPYKYQMFYLRRIQATVERRIERQSENNKDLPS